MFIAREIKHKSLKAKIVGSDYPGTNLAGVPLVSFYRLKRSGHRGDNPTL